MSAHAAAKVALSRVRAISFDVTGTVLVHKYPIFDTYAEAAVWAKLPDPPSAIELKPAFKAGSRHTRKARIKEGSDLRYVIASIHATL